MSEEDLQNEAVETQEAPAQEVARPDYVPEEYWANGQVDVKKMTDDLAMDKKRIDDLRRIISQPKKPEPYDKLFEDRELNDYQKEDMSVYVKLANKIGLSKKQAEQLYDDYSAVLQERYQKQVEEYSKQLEEEKKAFGPEYQNVVDELKPFFQCTKEHMNCVLLTTIILSRVLIMVKRVSRMSMIQLFPEQPMHS